MKTKVSNTIQVIAEYQLKCYLKKITTEDGAKKTKRLTKIQLLTKDLISYKIRYVFQKKKVTLLVKPIKY